MQEQNDNTISKYDRLRGNLKDIALFAKPTTVQDVQTLTGRAETFVVITARAEMGDYIFVECIDDQQQVTRLALPPKVSNAIARQRDALSARRRSITSKRVAAERMAQGWKPNFKKGAKA